MGNHLLKQVKKGFAALSVISVLCSSAPSGREKTTISALSRSTPLTSGEGDAIRGELTPETAKRWAYCVPRSTNSNQYISEVKFLGTLNADTSNSTRFSAGGYADYTGLSEKARQVTGGVVNVNVSVNDAAGVSLSTPKAWVDWNKDGVFAPTAAEKVYDISEIGVRSGNVIFGFVVPAGTAAGFYTIRIRASGTQSNFDACGTVTSGEAEDYSFEVVNTCAALITSVQAQKRCGEGPVTLRASATSDTVAFQWFTSEFGAAITAQNSATYTTPSLAVGTHTFYVSAYNGSCYSTFRTPVKVVVSPTSEIQFSQSSPDICGPLNSIVINSSADKEEVNLLEEDFEGTGGNDFMFENQSTGNTNADGMWKVRANPYIPTTPPYNVVRAAISSGYEAGNFASIITDVRPTTNIFNHYVLKQDLNSTGFTDLKVDYSLYYFSEEDLESKNYLKLQYSLDGGLNWVDVKTYISDVGIPSRFQDETVLLPRACENQSRLKIRFSVYALGSTGEWMADIVALDNVRIYGNREVPAQFIWSGNTTLFDASCEGPPLAEGSPSICIKPSTQEILQKGTFTITAAATLANGCSLSRTLVIENNTKIWIDTSSDWNTAQWKPLPDVPTSNKCVIIKTPVVLNAATNGFAKNVTVEPGGILQLQGNLTIGDGFINEASQDDVVIASGANLKQINDFPVLANRGTVTAKRTIHFKNSSREEYNYLISPLEDQNLKTVYPGVETTSTYPYILYHNETNNFFYNSSGAYIPGRGLAVKEPQSADVPGSNTDVVFKGAVANGIVTFPLEFTDAAHGYNLTGNPYPSNIDMDILYQQNSAAITSTFYFWDNAANNITVQMGSNYNGRAYALYNAVNGTGNEAGYLLSGNPGIGVKKPDRTAAVGQGFMVKALSEGKNLVFKNAVRVTDRSGAGFFSRGQQPPRDRYWLKLISPENYVNTIAVVYFEEGSNGFGPDDSQMNGSSSDSLYSLREDHQLVIEGKPTFTVSDRIILGSSHYRAGSYTFSLGETEGVFSSRQPVYLKDKATGILTNLSTGDYTFQAAQGATEGRFEVVYEPETVLAAASGTKDDLAVYRDGSTFVVKAQRKKITTLQVFDGAGRLVYSAKPHSLNITVAADQLSKGLYVFKIDQGGTVTTRKVMR